MTTSSFSPVLKPEFAEKLRRAVEHLEVPSEALILQIFFDIKRQFEAHRQSLEHEEAKVFAEGHAALARILLDAKDIQNQPCDDYFNRRTH